MRISDWSSDLCSSDLAFLAAIATEKVVALAVTERRERARVVAAAGRFDLQHFGAEIGKRQRRRGAGEHACEIEHAHALQRARPGFLLHVHYPRYKKSGRAIFRGTAGMFLQQHAVPVKRRSRVASDGRPRERVR